MSVESMTSLMGQDIQTSHRRALLVGQEIQMNLPRGRGWKEVVIEEKVAFILWKLLE